MQKRPFRRLFSGASVSRHSPSRPFCGRRSRSGSGCSRTGCSPTSRTRKPWSGANRRQSGVVAAAEPFLDSVVGCFALSARRAIDGLEVALYRRNVLLNQRFIALFDVSPQVREIVPDVLHVFLDRPSDDSLQIVHLALHLVEGSLDVVGIRGLEVAYGVAYLLALPLGAKGATAAECSDSHQRRDANQDPAPPCRPSHAVTAPYSLRTWKAITRCVMPRMTAPI